MNGKRRWRAGFCLGLAWVLVVALAAVGSRSALGAQKQGARGGSPPAEESVFVDRIDVRVVNLEAVVVDKQGHRVSGLGPGDFRLRVDGQEVPIGFFSEISDGRAVAEAGDDGAAATEVASGATPAATPSRVAPGEAVGISYLLFIDNHFSLTHERNRVLERMRGDLARLGPRDRMAIVAYNGRRLDLVSSWSGSAADLQRALDGVISKPARGFTTFGGVRAFDATVDLDEVDGGLNRDLEGESAIRELESSVERVVLAVTATLRGFGDPPGRKVMMLVSGGWPLVPSDFVLGATTPLGRSGSYEGPEVYRPIYDTANQLGYTLYPVDTHVEAGPELGIETAGIPDPNQSLRIRESDLHATLRRLAHETGGRALSDAAGLKAFDEVVEDTRSYYWLGFTPTWKGDDKPHRVHLEVLRPGLKVRSREGYLDLSRSTEISFMTEGALLFGALPGVLPLKFALGEAKKAGRRLEIPLVVQIPMDAVTMLPLRGRYRADLELRVGVINPEGERSEIPVIPVRLEGDKPPAAGQSALYETSLKLRKGEHRVVITLHDPLSGNILAAAGTFDPEARR